MCTGARGDADLAALRDALARHAGDPRLVAVGEIGLDHFVAGLDRDRQASDLRAPARPRRRVRPAGAAARPARRRHRCSSSCAGAASRGGIAHAFNGSEQQAGARSSSSAFASASAARSRSSGRCASAVSAVAVQPSAIVMETDSPDIPPQWRYRTAEARAAGATMRNEPAELARDRRRAGAAARRDGRRRFAAATHAQRARGAAAARGARRRGTMRVSARSCCRLPEVTISKSAGVRYLHLEHALDPGRDADRRPARDRARVRAPDDGLDAVARRRRRGPARMPSSSASAPARSRASAASG